MKAATVLVSALTVAAVTAGPASAAEGRVDGTIGAGDRSCSWTDGVTSDTAPNNLTVDRNSVNGKLSCSGVSATLNNNPAITFNDGAGTATADVLDVSVTVIGVKCSYRAQTVTAQREGTTRTYKASANAQLYSGGFLCPGTQTVNATLSFR